MVLDQDQANLGLKQSDLTRWCRVCKLEHLQQARNLSGALEKTPFFARAAKTGAPTDAQKTRARYNRFSARRKTASRAAYFVRPLPRWTATTRARLRQPPDPGAGAAARTFPICSSDPSALPRLSPRAAAPSSTSSRRRRPSSAPFLRRTAPGGPLQLGAHKVFNKTLAR